MAGQGAIKTVHEWRTERGLLQGELARLVNVAQSTISDIDARILLPNILLAQRIASALGVTTDEIDWRYDEDKRARLAKASTSDTPPDGVA